MAAPLNINDILSKVKQLDKKAQIALFQRMGSLIQRKEVKKEAASRLSSLSGMGSKIWKSSKDMDKYIEEERQW